MSTELTCRVISVMVVILLIVAFVLWQRPRFTVKTAFTFTHSLTLRLDTTTLCCTFGAHNSRSLLHAPSFLIFLFPLATLAVKIALPFELGAFGILLLGCLAWLANRLRHRPAQATLRASPAQDTLPTTVAVAHTLNGYQTQPSIDSNSWATATVNKASPGSTCIGEEITRRHRQDADDETATSKRRSVLVESSTQTSFELPAQVYPGSLPRQSPFRESALLRRRSSGSLESPRTPPPTSPQKQHRRFNIYRDIFSEPEQIASEHLNAPHCEPHQHEQQLHQQRPVEVRVTPQLSIQSSFDSFTTLTGEEEQEPNPGEEYFQEYGPVYAKVEADTASTHSTDFYFQFPSPTPSTQPDFDYFPPDAQSVRDYYSNQLPYPFEVNEEEENDDASTLENHSPKFARLYDSEGGYDYDVSESELSEAAAVCMASQMQAPPPAPPPMPGTRDAMVMPNWREHPFPVRESAPSKETIDKQQYAHLPDKLLNSMNKDKKPFTYTPSGVSGDKGVLDLTEIRSPRMKRRLQANLHAGDDELTTDEEGSRPGSSCSKSAPAAVQAPTPTKNLFMQPFAPCVLPPLDGAKSLRPGSASPVPPLREKKEVRFASSPIMFSDDEELTSKLEKRRLDVEARSKICTNQPEGEQPQQQPQQQQPQPVQPNHQQNGAPPPGPIIATLTPKSSFPSPTPPPQVSFNGTSSPLPQLFHPTTAPPPPPQPPTTYQDSGTRPFDESEMRQLVGSSGATVEMARKLNFTNQPYQQPASPVFDTNNNPTASPWAKEASLPSPPVVHGPSTSATLTWQPTLQPTYASVQAPPLPPTPSSQSFETVPVEQTQSHQQQQQQAHSGEWNVNSGNDRQNVERMMMAPESGAHHQQEEEQEQAQAQEEEMRQMIDQIESELSEMRLKEHRQTELLQQAPPSRAQEAPTLGEQEEKHSAYDCTPSRAPVAENFASEPLDAPSAFTPVAAPLTRHSPVPFSAPAMAAYQQTRPSAAYPGQSFQAQQQSAILENLFNDMQDEIAKFEAMSRETQSQSQSSPAAHTHTHTHGPSESYYPPGGVPSVQVHRKGPCGAPSAPPKPVRSYGGGSTLGGDGRTSCPPFQHEHLLEMNDGEANYRCITPSMDILKQAESQMNYGSYNQKAKPFYRAATEEPLYQSIPQRAFVQSVEPPPPQAQAPAPAPVGADGQPVRRSKRVIPFAFKNQLPRPADDVVPEIAEERIISVQQQIAERELYAHQARNRAIKTTKNFVNQCSSQGFRDSHTLPRTSHLAPLPAEDPSLPGHENTVTADANGADCYSQLPPPSMLRQSSWSSGVGPASPTTPTSPGNPAYGKMYYGSLPRKVKLNSRGQLDPPPPQPPAQLPPSSSMAPAKSYVNTEEGRQFLPSGMFSQLPPPPPPPSSQSSDAKTGGMELPSRYRPMSQPTPGSGKPYENTEAGRQFLPESGFYSQLSPGEVSSRQEQPPSSTGGQSLYSNNTTSNVQSYNNKEDARSFIPGTQMYSQMSPGVEPSRAQLYQTTPAGPQQVNGRFYTNKEEGRTFLPASKMFSQLPPGGEPGSTNGGRSFYDPYEAVKRQSSLPPPNSRGNTQIWTPPSTPPLPPVVNSTAYQQQQPKLSLQQIRRLPPSERPVEPTPSKYSGSHIPSRSFRLLQLITGEDIENQYAPQSEQPPAPVQPQRPASSMASYGRPPNPPPAPPVAPSTPIPFHNQQSHVSYAPLQHQQQQPLSSSDYGTDF